VHSRLSSFSPYSGGILQGQVDGINAWTSLVKYLSDSGNNRAVSESQRAW